MPATIKLPSRPAVFPMSGSQAPAPPPAVFLPPRCNQDCALAFRVPSACNGESLRSRIRNADSAHVARPLAAHGKKLVSDSRPVIPSVMLFVDIAGSKLSAYNTRQQGRRPIASPVDNLARVARPPIASPLRAASGSGHRAGFRAFRFSARRRSVSFQPRSYAHAAA
jgi:hypothetical protein